jgi:hypothetical protein
MIECVDINVLLEQELQQVFPASLDSDMENRFPIGVDTVDACAVLDEQLHQRETAVLDRVLEKCSLVLLTEGKSCLSGV